MSNGLTPEIRDDHAAYIASWLTVLKDDKKAIFTAASHAQKAADFLLSLQPAPAPDPEPDAEGGDTPTATVPDSTPEPEAARVSASEPESAAGCHQQQQQDHNPAPRPGSGLFRRFTPRNDSGDQAFSRNSRGSGKNVFSLLIVAVSIVMSNRLAKASITSLTRTSGADAPAVIAIALMFL